MGKISRWVARLPESTEQAGCGLASTGSLRAALLAQGRCLPAHNLPVIGALSVAVGACPASESLRRCGEQGRGA
jgi:hypothetical protein